MASIPKKSQGPATRHLLASEGPSSYQLNFYSTTYSTKYPKSEKFPSASFRHKGTGYSANFRPTVYYNKEVDRTQNPTIAKLLVDSYNSLTTRDYTPAQLNTGMEQLPASLYQGGRVSGYVHNAPNTRAPLVELTSSDTAYRNYYPLKQFRSDSNHPSMHTNKEESGFTHACNQEPITYRPTECHAGGLPGHLTWRPTGHSITRVDFKQAPLKSGHEAFSQLSFRACHSNGFVKGNCVPAQAEPIDQKGPYLDQLHPQVAHSMGKRDPAMFSVVTHPHQYTSYTSVTYPPKGVHPHTRQHHESVGLKELSGYADNTAPKLTNTSQTQSSTIFRESYHGNNLIKQPPQGDAPRPICPDGFTKSTRVHQYGPLPSSEEVLRKQKPYVTRSVVVQDPCYLDYTHRHKQRVAVQAY